MWRSCRRSPLGKKGAQALNIFGADFISHAEDVLYGYAVLAETFSDIVDVNTDMEFADIRVPFSRYILKVFCGGYLALCERGENQGLLAGNPQVTLTFVDIIKLRQSARQHPFKMLDVFHELGAAGGVDINARDGAAHWTSPQAAMRPTTMPIMMIVARPRDSRASSGSRLTGLPSWVWRGLGGVAIQQCLCREPAWSSRPPSRNSRPRGRQQQAF